MKKNKNFKIISIASGFVVLVILLISSTSTSSESFKLKGEDFLTKYNQTGEAVMLDVRTPAEFGQGHIENSINIDFENSSFTSEINKLDKTKTYFVYCRSGNRSGKAISIMKANGIKNIYELSGGISSNTELIK